MLTPCKPLELYLKKELDVRTITDFNWIFSMKKIMLFMFIGILPLSFLALAEEVSCVQLKQEGLTQEELAQRGCCSWHGGVCGCTGGRAVCCDGKLSPSCGCHGEDENSTLESNHEEVKG